MTRPWLYVSAFLVAACCAAQAQNNQPTPKPAALKTAFELGSPRLAVANAVGARVCLGDSGGPAVIRDRSGGMFLWGIATAVITPRGGSGPHHPRQSSSHAPRIGPNMLRPIT